jgi:hypothetical protein
VAKRALRSHKSITYTSKITNGKETNTVHIIAKENKAC